MSEQHTGKPTIRWTGCVVILLCPHGHIVESVHAKDWAGSWQEHIWPQLDSVVCAGIIPQNATSAS